MDTTPLDILEETVSIPNAGAALTGVLAYPLAGHPKRGALIVGPHPLMGGRLENNVVRSVGRGLAESGLMSLRFEFTGAETSAVVMEQFWQTGVAPDDRHRVNDARAAVAWFQSLAPGPLILVGYSFGASLLSALLSDSVQGIVLIGPTLKQHDYAALAESEIPKLIITADNDFATPLSATQAWCNAAASPKHLVVVPSAEHFYRGQEYRIVEEIVQWLPR